MSEEELWSMNRSTSKDFLLMLSFPGHWRRSAIISSLLPLAISLCSEVRGLCRHTKRRATKTPFKVKVGMFPCYPAQGQLDNNIKLALLGANLLWHLCLRVPFLHQCSFTSLSHSHTQKRGWLDGFLSLFFQCAPLGSRWAEELAPAGVREARGSAGCGSWGGQSSLKLEGEWSNLAIAATQVSQVWSDGPSWPNLLLVVRWSALLPGDKARGTLSHSLQAVFVKDSQWLSKNRQVGIQHRRCSVCEGGKKKMWNKSQS